jgi:hypothetical protein
MVKIGKSENGLLIVPYILTSVNGAALSGRQCFQPLETLAVIEASNMLV